AEGRNAGGKGQVVVDGLRNVSDLDCAARIGVDLTAAKGRIVAADRHQIGNAEPLEAIQHVGHVGRILGRVCPAGAEHAATLLIEGSDIGNGEMSDVRDVAVDEVLEAVADADDFEALVDGLNRDRANHPVDTGGRPTANHDAELAARRSRHYENSLR